MTDQKSRRHEFGPCQIGKHEFGREQQTAMFGTAQLPKFRDDQFRAGDDLLTMARVNADLAKDSFVFTATDGGYGKKTPIDEYRLQGRGGIGIKAAKIDENSRGSLVSALVLRDEDEILAITSAGTVMRTPAAEVRQTGRDSMGVRLVNLDEGVSLLSVTKNGEDEISAKS